MHKLVSRPWHTTPLSGSGKQLFSRIRNIKGCFQARHSINIPRGRSQSYISTLLFMHLLIMRRGNRTTVSIPNVSALIKNVRLLFSWWSYTSESNRGRHGNPWKRCCHSDRRTSHTSSLINLKTTYPSRAYLATKLPRTI